MASYFKDGKISKDGKSLAVDKSKTAFASEGQNVDGGNAPSWVTESPLYQSMKGMVSKKSFQEIKFLLPPKEIQLAFREIFEKLISTNEKVDASLHDIQNLSKSIFQRIIKREL